MCVVRRSGYGAIEIYQWQPSVVVVLLLSVNIFLDCLTHEQILHSMISANRFLLYAYQKRKEKKSTSIIAYNQSVWKVTNKLRRLLRRYWITNDNSTITTTNWESEKKKSTPILIRNLYGPQYCDCNTTFIFFSLLACVSIPFEAIIFHRFVCLFGRQEIFFSSDK